MEILLTIQSLEITELFRTNSSYCRSHSFRVYIGSKETIVLLYREKEGNCNKIFNAIFLHLNRITWKTIFSRFLTGPPNTIFLENALKKLLNIFSIFFFFLILLESTILPVKNGK